MQCICFRIKPEVDIESAWEQLENSGIQLLYSSEDSEGSKEIYGLVDSSADIAAMNHWTSISAATPTDLGLIDWSSQWENHGLNFHDGYVHVDLRDFGCKPLQDAVNWPIIRLQPGPGFGDLSHPTTNLVLKLMDQQLSNEYVLDVGCGSGVLALCAVVMGAKEVCGIDIDLEALKHAKDNAKLNGMEAKATFCTADAFQVPFSDSLVILMNMIRSEQEDAWDSLKKIHSFPGICLTSGVMVEEREIYLAQVQRWGWRLIKEIESEGWLGFQFSRF